MKIKNIYSEKKYNIYNMNMKKYIIYTKINIYKIDLIDIISIRYILYKM